MKSKENATICATILFIQDSCENSIRDCGFVEIPDARYGHNKVEQEAVSHVGIIIMAPHYVVERHSKILTKI
jgi:hypothetical protein